MRKKNTLPKEKIFRSLVFKALMELLYYVDNVVYKM